MMTTTKRTPKPSTTPVPPGQSIMEREADKAFRALLDDLGRLMTEPGADAAGPPFSDRLLARHPTIEHPAPVRRLVAAAYDIRDGILRRHM